MKDMRGVSAFTEMFKSGERWVRSPYEDPGMTGTVCADLVGKVLPCPRLPENTHNVILALMRSEVDNAMIPLSRRTGTNTREGTRERTDREERRASAVEFLNGPLCKMLCSSLGVEHSAVIWHVGKGR